MKLKPTYRFFMLFLACLMFVSSSKMSWNMHLCQQELRNLNLFGLAKSCNENSTCSLASVRKKIKPFRSKEQNSPSCCSDIRELKTNDYQSQKLRKLDFSKKVLISKQYFYEKHFKITFYIKKSLGFLIYKPPKFYQDIIILVQSFLI